ncbi:DUF2865 domain-containing protein [Bradyrhizobium sp.]|uniref:DUF2865 domain-containing protein n=1 Tax=Bradyrhizobium sp. TaxID=376 RepID=UPI0025BC46A2|nr:DUF2865 domain-containing protein [Bradyrhizobium sp.]
MLLGTAASALPSASNAQARDFFSTLFGGFGRPPAPPPLRAPFFDDLPPFREEAPPARRGYSGGQAWCVRTCDGRYFPVVGSDKESRANLCNSFCPASETKLVYGGEIDDAFTESGKPYSELPNAFRYRKELVADCTCNGKDQVGLAPVKIEDDPTLRNGDIVADRSGLVVANRRVGRNGVALNFSPVPEKLRARFRHVPVVAKE